MAARNGAKKVTKKAPAKKQAAPIKGELRLTSLQLEHLRDLMGVLVPGPERAVPLSQLLAHLFKNGRVEAEVELFEQVGKACEAAGIPFGDDAPDFAVTALSSPPLGVFPVEFSEEDEGVEDEG